jgi:hypothetical protein
MRGLLPAIDRRSPHQIDSDLEDEISFHLHMRTCDLQHEGFPRDEAGRVASERFGNIDRIRRQCKRIALRERIMLQRVSFVMMVIVMLMVIGVGVQMWMTQRATAEALRTITSEITHMRTQGQAAPSVAQGGMVYLDGDVARPGAYAIPLVGPLTVRRLLATAGGVLENRDARVTVFQLDADGTSRFKLKDQQFIREDDTDYLLGPNDHVHVERLSTDAEIAELMNAAPAARIASERDRAEREKARADAVTAFLQAMLASPDPGTAANLTVREVLDRAASKANEQFADDPQTLARIQQAIDEQRAALEAADPAATDQPKSEN